MKDHFLGCSASSRVWISALAIITAASCWVNGAAGIDPRGAQFMGFNRFSGFEKTRGARALESVLTSPIITTRIGWNELIASWNAEMPGATYLKIEARAIYLTGATKYYVLGNWSSTSSQYPRESVPGQKDDYGDVATDTLILREPAQRLQVRVTLGSDDLRMPVLKFLGLSLTDTRVEPSALPPNRRAWDTVLPVPERSQMQYPNGKVLCSPTTVSMIMSYWADKLGRPDLDNEVPQIVDLVYDPQWKGTGNWAFNMAYAGSCRGMRAYVTRMTSLSELEDWIAAGVPVGLSVCYDRLRGRTSGPNGHLVVCVGFTAEGDPIINDPGTSQNVRKVFPRKNVAHAWAYSRNAAYLIYPQRIEIPKDRFGHWDSWTARQRIEYE